MLIVQFANTIPIAYLLALIAVALTSMFSSMFMITSMTVMQLKVPDYLRGRVMGLHGITYSLMPLGGLFAGLLASVTSVPVAIAIGVVIYLCILAGIALGQKELVNLSGRSDI
jgi:MFS family permease